MPGKKRGSRAGTFHAFVESHHSGVGIHTGLFILCVSVCTEARGFTLAVTPQELSALGGLRTLSNQARLTGQQAPGTQAWD